MDNRNQTAINNAVWQGQNAAREMVVKIANLGATSEEIDAAIEAMQRMAKDTANIHRDRRKAEKIAAERKKQN